jgi:DNA mismatch repair ATPase MutS
MKKYSKAEKIQYKAFLKRQNEINVNNQWHDEYMKKIKK